MTEQISNSMNDWYRNVKNWPMRTHVVYNPGWGALVAYDKKRGRIPCI